MSKCHLLKNKYYISKFTSIFFFSLSHVIGAELQQDVDILPILEEHLEPHHSGVLQRSVDLDLGLELLATSASTEGTSTGKSDGCHDTEITNGRTHTRTHDEQAELLGWGRCIVCCLPRLTTKSNFRLTIGHAYDKI